MNREEKLQIIEDLTQRINSSSHFYLTDTSELNAEVTGNIRRKCFEKEIELIVVKNTLLRKALERADKNYEPLYDSLKGSTSIMFCEQSSIPGKLIQELRKKLPKPVLKAAFVEESFYIGDNQIEALATIKSKEELIGDLVALLQSPARTVLSQLQSGGNILQGVCKTLSEK